MIFIINSAYDVSRLSLESKLPMNCFPFPVPWQWCYPQCCHKWRKLETHYEYSFLSIRVSPNC